MANLSDLVGLAGGSGVGGFASGIASGLQLGLGQINQARALGLQEEGQKFQQQAAKDLTYLKGLDLVLQNPEMIGAVTPIFTKYGFDPSVLEPLAKSGRESRQVIAAMRTYILKDGEVDEPTRALLTSPIAGKIGEGYTELLKTFREINQRKGINQAGVALSTRASDLMGQTPEAGRTAAASAEAVVGESPAPPPLGREPAFRQAGQEALAAGRPYTLEAIKGAKELFAAELSPEQQQVRAAAPVIQGLMLQMATGKLPIEQGESLIVALPGGKEALASSTTWQAHKARMTAGGTKLGEAGALDLPVNTPPASVSALVGGGGPVGVPATTPRPLDRLYGGGAGVFRRPDEEVLATPPTAQPGAGRTAGEVRAAQAGLEARAKEPSLDALRAKALAGQTPEMKALREAQTRAADAAAGREPADVRKGRTQADARAMLDAYTAGRGPELTNEQINELHKDAGIGGTKGLSMVEMAMFRQRRAKALAGTEAGAGGTTQLTPGGDVVKRAAPGRSAIPTPGADAKRATPPPANPTAADAVAQLQRLIAAGHTKESALAAMRQVGWR